MNLKSRSKCAITLSSPGCGGNLIGTVGSFSSPGHPKNYPHGVACDWYITVEPGMVIRLTFNTFNLERSENCQYDYVEIFDNSTSTETGGPLGRLVLRFSEKKTRRNLGSTFDQIQRWVLRSDRDIVVPYQKLQ